MKAKKIVFWTIFAIILTIYTLFIIFYLDLANGPLGLLIFEIFLISVYVIVRILIRHTKIHKRLLITFGFIFMNIIVIISAHPKVGTIYAVSQNATKTDILEVEAGKIQGVYNNDESVMVYAGIPYAKAPVGDLRWKEPQDLDTWEGIRDCSKFGPRSFQAYSNEVISSLVDIYASKSWHPDYSTTTIQAVSEDSLYLNIWKPNTTETNLPVLVYIHGGSLTTGTSASADINGEEMARTGVIFVTIQYRLGVFGYFAHEDLIDESTNNTTGNYGLLDQIKALEWINDNITSFGGDKNNITIAGESAGSSSVSALCVSPLAKGLFQRAIGESSSVVVKTPPHTYRKMSDALKVGQNIMNEFNCKSIAELRDVKASNLVNTKYSNSGMTLDGYALTKTPYETYLAGENNEEALLNGYNVKEADAFVVPTYLLSPTNKNNIEERLNKEFDSNTTKKLLELYKDRIEENAFEAFNEIISIYWFIYPHQSWSTMAYNNGVDVYRYQFTKENGYYGTYHSGEIIYAYGNVKNSKYDYRYDESDRKLSESMLKYWSNFAKTGDPNGDNNPTWELWDKNKNNVLELGSNIFMKDDQYVAAYKIIEEFIDTL